MLTNWTLDKVYCFCRSIMAGQKFSGSGHLCRNRDFRLYCRADHRQSAGVRYFYYWPAARSRGNRYELDQPICRPMAEDLS